MICSTEGIVLHTIKYSDSSIIARIYTKEFGIGSFIMNNVRGKRSKMAYFQPLSQICLSVYKHNKAGITRIKTVEFSTIHLDIFSNIYKAGIAHFLGEVLSKIIEAEDSQVDLYHFLSEKITALENTKNSIADFHIVFLLELLPFFGVNPSLPEHANAVYFDIHAGVFTAYVTQFCISSDASAILLQSLTALSQNKTLTLNKAERRELLEVLITYYRIHVRQFSTIESVRVLQSVFS